MARWDDSFIMCIGRSLEVRWKIGGSSLEDRWKFVAAIFLACCDGTISPLLRNSYMKDCTTFESIDIILVDIDGYKHLQQKR